MINNLDNEPLSAEQLELMERLHITHSLVNNFHYRDYRYTKLDDAVAQATRKEGT